MTRWVLTGLLALAAPASVAVFGVDSATAEAAPSASPFAGSWAGTWTVFEVEVIGTGTFDWSISDAGRITGTVYHTETGGGGTMVGHVGADGSLMMIGYVPSDAPGEGFNGVPFQGTAVIDGDGRLVVSVNRTDTDGSLVAILERN